MTYVVAGFLGLLLIILVQKHKAHALGAWAAVLTSNGLFVYFLGSDAGNIGLFVGLGLVPFVLWNRNGFWVDWLPLALLSLFLVVGAFSAVVNQGDMSAVGKLAKYAKPILLCILIMGGIDERRTFSVVALYILAAGVFGGLFNIYQEVFGAHIYRVEWDPSVSRALGLRGDANDTAMLLLATLPMAYVWLIDARFFNTRILAVAALLIIVAGVILTKSRAGFLVTIILAALFTLHQVRSGRRSLFGVPGPKRLFLAAVLVVAAVLAAPAAYWERVETLITGEESGTSLAGRAGLLEKGFDFWLNNPVLGVGPGRLAERYQSEASLAGKRAAHNMYIELIAEVGFIGAAPVLSVFFIAMIRLLRLDAGGMHADRDTNHVGFGYALGLLAMLLMGFTLSQGHNSILWFFVGLGLAAKRWAPPARQDAQTPLDGSWRNRQ